MLVYLLVSRDTKTADTNMPLTEIGIRSAKPRAKIVKLSDGGGLQLWITPDGAKRWRLAYRFAGNQKTLALGVYPATGLRNAREARDAAKRLLNEGIDPGQHRRAENTKRAAASTNTFDAIAAELLDKKRRERKADRTITKFEWFMSLARPGIGSRPIADISAPEILAVLRQIEARGRQETARKLRGAIGQVFRFAVATGRAQRDPTGALKGALTAPVVNHRAAIIEPKAFGGLLRAIASYEGAPETRAALELLALTFVRPGELRAAEWADFDLAAGIWAIPAAKMKMNRPHRVPLAPQAVSNPARPAIVDRPREIRVPVSPLGSALYERKHHQCSLAASRLHEGRNDRPRLSIGGMFNAERKRPLERRRNRAPVGACR